MWESFNTVKRVAPHLRLATAIKIANVWLLEDGHSRRFLLDTGYFLDRPILRALLWQAGVRHKGDLTAVLLTHRHSDHAANAGWLRKTFDCPVICHRKDAPYLAGEKKPRKLCRGIGRFYQELLCAFEDRIPAKTPIDEVYEDGAWKWGFHIVHTPGHTEGSVMLHHEPTKTLFSGDSIIAGPAPLRLFELLQLADPAFSLEVEDCHEAIATFVRELPPTDLMASGHGPVVRERIQEKLMKLIAQTATTS